MPGTGGRQGSKTSSYLLVRRLLPLVIGYALYRMWEELHFVGSPRTFDALFSVGGMGFSRHELFFLAKGLTLLASALVAFGLPGVVRLRRTRPTLAFGLVACALLALSTAGLVMSQPDGTSLPVIAASVVGGVGVGLTTLLWLSQCVRFGPLPAIMCYLAASVLSALATAVYRALFHDPSLAMSLVLPLASLLAILLGARLAVDGEEPGARLTRELPVKNVALLMALFGFTFAMREPGFGNGVFESGSFTSLGSLLAVLLVFTGVVMGGGRCRLSWIFGIVLPIVAIAFLVLPTGAAPLRFVSDTCASAATELIDVLAMLVGIAACCWRLDSPVLMFGLLFGARYLSVALGEATWWAFGLLGTDAQATASLCMGVVSACAVALTVVLMPGKDMFDSWGLDALSKRDDGMRPHALPGMEDRISGFARTHGLTSREEEILGLLIQDKTNREIQQALGVGLETVRTHRRNVYEKCGVHSLDELMRAVGLERVNVVRKAR